MVKKPDEPGRVFWLEKEYIQDAKNEEENIIPEQAKKW
jgi:hypothetical protein